jgi:hypothetical protein
MVSEMSVNDASGSTASSSGHPLPDTEKWLPRNGSQTLTSLLVKEGRAAEERLLRTLKHETETALDNFDSGPMFEQAVRREMELLLPKRYSVTSARLLDCEGMTAGNCDVVLFNETWFSPIKAVDKKTARHQYLPIESVYAVGEVKQTLSAETLDRAMEKLITCHRLGRPKTFANRVVENREGTPCPHGLTNPLFSFILAGRISPGDTFQDLIGRFFEISKKLKRLEVVRALCVLNEGVVVWSFRDPRHESEIRPARFIKDDLFQPIFPVFSPASSRSPFLFLMQMLHQGLFPTILAPEDLSFVYGLDPKQIKIPTSENVSLPVDQEWAELLNSPCEYD